MNKAIILCADDFSLNPAINAGILSLLELGRLTAVSCMTQSPTWQQDAQELRPWQDQADIGLHFNLTQFFPNAYCLPLPLLMIQSQFGIISKQKVQDSFCSQLDAFEKAMRGAPDFIDGHQHVHVFPILREIIVNEYVKRYDKSPAQKPYIRSLEILAADKKHFKAKVLQYMGANKHGTLLKKHKIPHNSAFAGIYDFNPKENLNQRMNEWLNALPDNGLIMCHPATDDALVFSEDPIADARTSEFLYLSGITFLQTLKKNQSQLSRLG